MNFLNVDEDFAGGALLHVGLELIDLRAFTADDDAGASRLDDDAQLVPWPLDLEGAYTRRLKLLFKLLLELVVFEQQLVVVALHKPARLPGFGVAQAKSVWMNFLSHRLLISSPLSWLWRPCFWLPVLPCPWNAPEQKLPLRPLPRPGQRHSEPPARPAQSR